ncbi:hypothetical protein V2H45_05110 [Tumidithrix elongata RA019]|uniref:Transmembrane protein n=1 Tax=Tumidithrix elongata BACA0141 TaxID=2716417 RepID=A0AAW9PQX8_9CYAN|nr:hypothetical protein [Tumidithrix elongata RA019]
MSHPFLGFWSGWRFLPLWIVATCLGFAIGGPVSALIPDYVTAIAGNNAANILSFGVMSLTIALPQWLVLRGRIRDALWWLVVTTLGGMAGGPISMTIAWNLSITFGDAVDLFAIYAALRGATTGLAQWTFLRVQMPQAGWWAIATSVSWYSSLTIGSKVMFTLPSFTVAIVGASYGVMTGIVMFLLLRQKAFAQSKTNSANPK